jgi:acetyl-CoA carboxylase biotin carboxyl carrier protein
VTEPLDRPTDDATASANADAAADAFTPADHVSAGEALAPDLATGSTDGGGSTAGSADAMPMEAPTTESAQTETPPLDDPPTDMEAGDASLLGLIDRLGAILERSDLTELEVESGRTTVILRKPIALVAPIAAATAQPIVEASPVASPAPAVEGSRGTAPGSATAGGGAPARPSVKAPLTGIWYASPTPGSAPFVEVGRELAVGQVVGLIEAMKLFNEIKSDLAGRVVRVVPDSGTLVKAKQPLIEVEPL